MAQFVILGEIAYRDTMEGSQFIKTLSRIIPKEAHRKDLQKITKMVNDFILVFILDRHAKEGLSDRLCQSICLS